VHKRPNPTLPRLIYCIQPKRVWVKNKETAPISHAKTLVFIKLTNKQEIKYNVGDRQILGLSDRQVATYHKAQLTTFQKECHFLKLFILSITVETQQR
jgi:hypothetical protein